MLEIANLSITSRKEILKNFTYTFTSGNLYGLVAVNGAGKTTFFRSITDLIPRDSGQINLNKKPISQNKSDIFYFEISEWLDKNVSGKDYLKFVKKAWRSSKDIEEVISYWDMKEYVNIPIKKYSLGMKQRLLIAMYTVSDASCLIMDEITNGLDEQSRKKLFLQLNTLVKRENKIIIISSHYAEDISAQCDYILSFNNCKLEVKKNELF
ncbi:ATP-binding cassette domain-containing protein [Vagococcus vulneris]|uniref:Peptide ABC transporter ATP-binding protein n=1 Tax=Vagococcus vulneris TaxID=1977869 RepID=A0A430A119_9ENTE|nr:ABC transporter ATP-binding protein [Vagococcus vulneris]RSU00105.1 peptide ABC transporter ATP-binding protein [Vagococcus vulneris]